MSSILKPKKDRLVIEAKKQKDITEGGIIIPDKAKERPHKAVVISIGPEVEDIVVGEKIIFSKYAGTVVKLDKKAFLIIREEDVIASYE
tara:strand:- start:325 stop:591 length:267 start_codon:yes stop_codon:yes gene_type:complete